ncbi:hypothetical protein H4S14_004309 [Agrobacterium vitis]|nr:hypothetical protein [Agrobacterium vitis]
MSCKMHRVCHEATYGNRSGVVLIDLSDR